MEDNRPCMWMRLTHPSPARFRGNLRCPSPCQCYVYLKLCQSYPDYRFSKVYLNNLYLTNPGDRNKHISLCSNFLHSYIVEDTLKTTTTTINQGHVNKFQQCLSVFSKLDFVLPVQSSNQNATEL